MSNTKVLINNVTLDVSPFEWNFYRGFTLQPCRIKAGLKRALAVSAVVIPDRQDTLRIISNDGSVDIKCWVHSVDIVETNMMEVEIYDNRFLLSRNYLPLDLNVNTSSELINPAPDADGNVIPELVPIYLPGTNEVPSDVNKATTIPLKLDKAIEKIMKVMNDEWKGILPELKWTIHPESKKYIEEQTVPDNTNIGGIMPLEALAMICEPKSVDLVVKASGDFLFVHKDQSLLPGELTLAGFKWIETPSFLSKPSKSNFKPRYVINPYLIREEVEATIPDVTSSPPTKWELRLVNVFRAANDTWVPLDELFSSQGLGETFKASPITQTNIANNFFSNSWEGTYLRQDPHPTLTLADPDGWSELDRAVKARRIVAQIKQHWRRTWKLTAIGPNGELLFDQLKNFQGANVPIRANGPWIDIEFGALKNRPSFNDDAANTIRDSFLNEDVLLHYLTYKTGQSARCEWVDQYAETHLDPTIADLEDAMAAAALFGNNTSGPAPFDCQWVDVDKLVFTMIPQEGYNIATRIPGRMNKKNQFEINAAFDKDIVELLGLATKVSSDGNIITLPTFISDFSLTIKFNGTRRSPPDKRIRYHEVKTDCFPDGAGTFTMTVDPTKFAILTTGGAQPEIPINADALQLDTEQRVYKLKQELGRVEHGVGYINGISAISKLTTYGAISNIAIEVGTRGMWTVLTRVELGNYSPIDKNSQAKIKDISAKIADLNRKSVVSK